MFFGHLVAGHPAPPGALRGGQATVISQIAQAVYGSGGVGHALFIFTQAATMLILVLAANTSFADFPRLASFQAEDYFMPRQLTKRGHRLVFSNGIIALSITAAVLVIVLGADVTSSSRSTPSACSPASPSRRRAWPAATSASRSRAGAAGLLINGTGAVVTAVVTVVIAGTKFIDGRVGDHRPHPDPGRGWSSA